MENDNETIVNIKRNVRKQSGIAIRRQKLSFAGTELENNKSLEDYNIPNDGKLDLVLKPTISADDVSNIPNELTKFSICVL